MAVAYQWIDTDKALEAALARWQQAPRLYMDTEFMRERTYDAVLALIQVNDGSGNTLVDPVSLTPAPVMALLADKPLVMHACSEDLMALQAWGGEPPRQVEDTQIAAALCGYDLQCGYQKLVQVLLDVELPKDATRTDWLKRPLSESQLEYAVLDVHYLPDLRDKLVARLEELGRLTWWQEECARLVQEALSQTPAEDLWRGVKGAASLTQPEARARLQALAAWRDGAARARNLPRSFVIMDAELRALCASPPQSSRQLADSGLHPQAIRRYGDQLMQLLHASHGEAPAALPGAPDAATRNLTKRLRKVVSDVAGQLQIAPEVLARRRWLESLVLDPGKPVPAFQGWRRELVLAPLLEALDE